MINEFLLLYFSEYVVAEDEPFNKAILDGFAASVGIFMLSSVRNCIIYSLRNREYRSSSKLLWRSIINKIYHHQL